MTTSIKAIIAASLMAALVSATADELASWEWVSPKPAGDFLTKITFDGTRFVGVGDMGVILTSANGTTWNLSYTDTTNRMFGITAGAGKLLAYGNSGTLLVSTNADFWSQVPLGSISPIYAAARGLDRFVLIDAGQRLFTSADANQWDEHVTAPTNVVNDLAYGDDLFVAVGIYGLIATSTNGVDWIHRESGALGPIWSVAYGDGKWVAVGGEGATGFILSSADAIVWAIQTTDQPLNDVSYGPFGFLVTGGGFMDGGVSMSSPDGIYFSGSGPGESGLDSAPNGVACGNGACVAVGDHGRIWTTTDGTNWISQLTAPIVFPNSFATDGQLLVAVGGTGAIYVSSDGQTFANRTVDPGEFYSQVLYTGDRFVSVGGNGLFRSSVNGWDWPAETTGTDSTFFDVAHGNGTTVALGWEKTGRPYGLFAVRDSSGVWQVVRPAPQEYLNTRLAFGNGRFVAAGYDGKIWTSVDGLNWQKIDLGTGLTILPIQFLNGRFIGFTGVSVGTSIDGLNWNFTPGNPPSTRQIAFGNGLYLAVGDTRGGLHTSEDGSSWTLRPMKTLGLTSAIYFKDAFYVSGFILKSRSSLIPEIQSFSRSGGGWNFDLFGRIGRDYELQSSTDLVNWDHEQDYTQSARQHPLTLPTGPDQRFYRVKLK